eukprot:SAG11_NODE_2057_length_3875_cov_3.864936_1_plen_191_part_00
MRMHSTAQAAQRDISEVFAIGELLGEGVTGHVRRGVSHATGQSVAIKTIDKRRFLRTERAITTTKREIDIMRRLSQQGGHPHVVNVRARGTFACSAFSLFQKSRIRSQSKGAEESSVESGMVAQTEHVFSTIELQFEEITIFSLSFLQLFDVFESPESIFIVMELVDVRTQQTPQSLRLWKSCVIKRLTG